MTTEREQLIRSLFDEYIELYSSRDDRLTTRFSDNFSGFAGSSDVLVTDRDEWIRITRRDFAQIPAGSAWKYSM
ncbi:nuclear transport factor 2 family protein [Aeromonas veronii]